MTVTAPTRVRLAEVLAALSLATDAGNGFPLEKSLRVGVIAVRLGERLCLGPDELSDTYYVGLLRSIGCTAYAPETAALLGGDDIAFHTLFEQLDPGRPAGFVRDVVTGMGAWAPPLVRARSVARFLTIGAREGRKAGRAACEVSVGLARRLGLSDGVQAGLDTIYERWDGRGIPDGVSGDDIPLPARITHVADIAAVADCQGGDPAAAVAARSGGHFDPAVAGAFDADLLTGLDDEDALELMLALEPEPTAVVPRTRLAELAAVLGDFADLKSFWTAGHSRAVAELVGPVGHLHDIGRVAVPNSVWDKRGPLSAAEWDQVRLHTYYTDRILDRVPALAPWAPVAAAHHERCDGSGYHRRVDGAALSPEMRRLAAADAYAAMTADRPQRPALDPGAAAGELRADARAGRLCPDAVETVLEAAGHRRERAVSYPCDLTEREVEVLRLLARGLTNKEIGAELVVSPRTVQHHVAHVYDKIDRRTRAGATLFAMEHGIAR